MNTLAEKGLPCNLDAERLVLGSILLDGQQYELVAGALRPDDFALEKHRRILAVMETLYRRGDAIDRVTVHDELLKRGESQACDGLSYLIWLDDGLPQIPNLDSYVRIIQEKSTLRRSIFTAQSVIDRCLIASDDSASILADAKRILGKLAEDRQGGQWLKPGEVMLSHPGGLSAFLQPPPGGAGIPTPWPAITRALCGLHRGDLFLVAGRPSMGKSIIGMALAHHCAACGEGAAIFSLEMTSSSMVQRLDIDRRRSGCPAPAERKARRGRT